jgi:hypothetical protein
MLMGQRVKKMTLKRIPTHLMANILTNTTASGTQPLSHTASHTTDNLPHRLLEMPEIEREEVIAQRLEEIQRITDKRNLDQMLKAQKDGDGDSVAKAGETYVPKHFPRTSCGPYLQASTLSAVRLRKSRGNLTS